MTNHNPDSSACVKYIIGEVAVENAACPACESRNSKVTNLSIEDSIKMLRETFCQAQASIIHGPDDRWKEHVARLGRLIDECDRQRPLATNGKHGNLHTPTCGCED